MSGQTIFISYSRQDIEFVSRLIADLQAAGINVWIDQQGLMIGTLDWQRAIRDAIRDSYALVLIVSPHSAESRYVQAELEIARMYECKVYPVWVAGDGKYGEYVPFELIRSQYLDAREQEYTTALLELLKVLGSSQTVPVRNAPTVSLTDPHFKPRNPYKGLRAFTSIDRSDFFGRGGLIQELIEAVSAALVTRNDSARLLAVVGPSGSGKSSVVMAGLLPQLQAGVLPGSESWVYLEPVLPGSQPLESLAVSLAAELKTSISAVLDDLDRSARGLHLLGRQAAKGRDTRVILLIDQFEELFTQAVDSDKRDHFIALLLTAATEAEGNLFVILTLRADFYDRPMNYTGLGKLLETHSKHVLPMSLDSLRDVIEKPSTLPDVRLEFEPGLVGDLLFEVREQVGALPLLEFTLDQLVENREGRLLTRAAYDRLGGVKGALAKHAENTYENLSSDAHREMARALFLRLIEPGPTEQETTRRRAAQSEFITPNADKTEILQQVIFAFVDARLLTTSKIASLAMIEVSHEALIREWLRLARWLRTARDDVRLQQIISRDAQEWVRRGKRPDDLYRGEKLEDILDWAQRNTISAEEDEFIKSSFDDETKRRQEALLIRQLIDIVPDLIYVKDSNGKYLIANRTDMLVKGVSTLDSLIGKSDFDFFPPEYAQQYGADEEHLLRIGQSLIGKLETIIDQKGNSRWYSTTKVPYRDDNGDIIGLVAISRDVTERIQMENELRLALEKEKELNELKSRFVSMTSHEFRTPLATIAASCEILVKYMSRLTPDKVNSHLEKIQMQVRRLIDLLGNVLELSKVQTGAIQFTPKSVDLKSFCMDVINQFHDIFHSTHGFSYSIPDECADITLDERLFNRVLTNLLSNAFKYSPDGSTVSFEVFCEPDKTSFRVTDEGIGIPEQDQKYIFEAFHRAGNASSIMGTGLGLAISKQAVEMHDGTISFESDERKGTTFTVTIPKR